ncbi:MAG: bis(5'-nucleosyl)-tetraphosphatase (symmetrical) YqeK [Syntrophomonadaceae bacterium]|nr:bis(5'-nucleosyl)-tetraphosphatase (symmetrical) YqeK [Syntrophomonadaceae bacterium]
MYNEQQLQEIIRQRLSPSRFQHSREVARVARELAEIFGVDADKAYITGLLHDYAKGLSGAELLSAAEKGDLIQHEMDYQIPDLLHAPVGAWLLQQELEIEDQEILKAVAVHTTGDLNMSKLEEIIYLADMVEPGRDYPGQDRLKCLAYRDLKQAMLFGLETTLRYCLDEGRLIHPRTVEVRNAYLKRGDKSFY